MSPVVPRFPKTGLKCLANDRFRDILRHQLAATRDRALPLPGSTKVRTARTGVVFGAARLVTAGCASPGPAGSGRRRRCAVAGCPAPGQRARPSETRAGSAESVERGGWQVQGDGFRSRRKYMRAARKIPGFRGPAVPRHPHRGPAEGGTAGVPGFARLCRRLEHISALFEE